MLFRSAIDAAEAKAVAFNIKVNIAVVDAGGRLVASARMDGATWSGVWGAQGKAITSAAFGRPSGLLQERNNLPIMEGIRHAEGGNMIMHQGAVPIFRDGALIGAIGVGGGTSEQDEACAQAGADRVAGK